MQLGLVTYMWGADWDLPTLIKNCQLTGFRGVELRHHAQTWRRARRCRPTSAARWPSDSPTAASNWSGWARPAIFIRPTRPKLKKNIEEAKAFIKLSHDCGGTGIKVRPNGLPKEVPVAPDARADRPLIGRVGRVRRRVRSGRSAWKYTAAAPTSCRASKRSWTPPRIRAPWFAGIAIRPIWQAPGWSRISISSKTDLGTIHIHDLISELSLAATVRSVERRRLLAAGRWSKKGTRPPTRSA